MNEKQARAKGGVILENKKKLRMSKDEKSFALELFKAHFTAKEAVAFFPFGYHTLRNLWRSFEDFEIEKYDRMDLIVGGRLAYANINAG